MAQVPVNATLDVQKSVRELNDELRDLYKELSKINLSPMRKDIEDLQKDVSFLQHLRRIPPPGQRIGTTLGPLYLNDSLFWSSPNATAISVTVTLVSSSTTVLDTWSVVLVDCASGNVTLTLPPAVAQTGRYLQIKKVDSTLNKAIIDGAGSDTIDDELTLELLYKDEAVELVSDGTSEWNVF